MENVKKFYEALLADKALQEKVNQLHEQFKPESKAAAIDEAALIQSIVTFAKTQGYDFTPEELKTYHNEIHAIPDEQLDTATGGKFSTGATRPTFF